MVRLCLSPGEVRALIVDALRHWAAEYDVDGFCFVNAENMAQGAVLHTFLHAPLPLHLIRGCRKGRANTACITAAHWDVPPPCMRAACLSPACARQRVP